MQVLASIVICALLAGGDGPSVEVRCKTEASIRGTEILLADVAEVRVDDTELLARLLAISFGPRPGFGYSRQLSRNDVMLRLAHEGLSLDGLHLTGADDILVQPLFRTLDPQEILDAAEPVLRAAMLHGADEDFELEPAPRPKAMRFPPGRRSFELTARVRDGRVQPTSAIVDIGVLVDGEEAQIVPVSFRIRRFHYVLATTQVVRQGDPLGEHNLELRRIEAAYGTSHWLTALDDVRGMVAARDLRAAQQLSVGAAVAPAVVARGDQVTLVVNNSRIRVATRAIAQESGRVGDPVVVTNLSSGTTVQATVAGPGVVVIQPVR
jgi:flagella basal body P-ring formation protein FlgA